MNERFTGVLSSPKRALIEQMFEKHRYTNEDVEDFFNPHRMDKRFGDQLKEIRAERAKRMAEPVLQQCQDEPCTD